MESAGPKVISTLTVNYKPAIDATKQLMEITTQLDNQLRTLRITALDVGKNVGANFAQPIQSGQVILDRHGKVLVDLSAKTDILTQGTKKVNDAAQDHIKTVNQTSQAYSILGSQWERRISWFMAGAGFYGFIRAARQALDTMRQIEMDMVVIARTIDDVTFNFKEMRDELQDLGMAYGHTWSTVSDIALRWTQAGYNMRDTLEQTRVGLLALNVAEMDVEMASQGMIAIMSQWGFTAQELEGVIDKLNVTSDNFAVTSGDLIDALVRSSGAAQAINLSFDETIGLLTAMRVATGRTGREVGNAANTIFSFITRQKTLNELMESGINVFADAANTKLRPAMDILSEIVAKWSDNVDSMPDSLVELAEKTGILSEEMANLVDMQQEWTDLQKIDIETAAAGVRRRSFFIALLRNFAQVQEVVNNMHNIEGYSMRQNIMTMESLDKQMEQLRVSIEKLAIALGDSGLLNQIKLVVDGLTTMVEWFNNLDSTAQTLIVTFAELFLAFNVLSTIVKMLGIGGLATAAGEGAKAATSLAAAGTKMSLLTKSISALKGGIGALVAVLGGPYVAAAMAAVAATVAIVNISRSVAEEQRIYRETLVAVAGEQERLDGILKKSVEGTTEYNLALEQKRKMIDDIVDRYPELIAGYDMETDMYILKTEKLNEAIKAMEELKDVSDDIIESSSELYDATVKESEEYRDSADRLERLYNQRENLIQSLREEGQTAEEYAKKKLMIKNTEEAIIRITSELDSAVLTSEDITKKSIDRVIAKYREKADEAEEAARRVIAATEREIKSRLPFLRGDLAREVINLSKLEEERQKYKKSLWMPFGFNLDDYLNLGEVGYFGYVTREIDAKIEESKAKIDGYRQEISRLEGYLEELNDVMIETAEETGSFGKKTDGAGKSTNKLGKSTNKLTDMINAYIDAAVRAADVQGMLNDELQREMDGLQARIKFYDKENATAWERNQVLQDEVRLREVAQQKYDGNHKQANLLREAVEKLRQKQASLNTSTEEGWQAYLQLESRIESLLDTISSLGIESFKLKEIINDNTRAIKEMERAYEEAIATLDYYNRFGIYTAEQYLREVNKVYSQFDNLTLEQERDMYSRRYDAYKQMLNDMKKEAEDAYRERIKILEKETEAQIDNYKKRIELIEEETEKQVENYKIRIKLLEKETQATIDAIQRQIDALDEEAKLEDREEERRKHEEKLQELYDERRYHELRTGREHSRAIIDIDKQIAEEMRQWELRQAEWAREDKKAQLQKEIEDIKNSAQNQREILEQRIEDAKKAAEQQREILEQRIEDVKRATEKERELWEMMYEQMQKDFSDHNLSLIAFASAYDPYFFEDAKRKGQLWIEGFKAGLPANSVSSYFDSLLGPIERRVENLAKSVGSYKDYESSRSSYTTKDYTFDYGPGTMELPGGGTVNLPGGTTTVSGISVKDAGGWDAWESIVERDLMDKGWTYDSSGVLQPPKSHSGSMVTFPGVAELIPGELIFPPNLSIQLQRLIDVLSARPLPSGQAQQQWRSGDVDIRGNLLNIENARFEDETDIEIMARELKRQLDMLSN